MGTDRNYIKEEFEAVGVFCSLGPVVGNLSSKELQDMGVLADLDVNIFCNYKTVC